MYVDICNIICISVATPMQTPNNQGLKTHVEGAVIGWNISMRGEAF